MSGFSNGFDTRISVRDCPHTPQHSWEEKNECKRLRLESEHATRKRSKQVFDTGEIPHLWAHKVQASARNSQGNLYFENEIIFSYGSHFPIAKHVTNKAGKKAILLTTEHRSVTTSGHVSAVRSAIPSDVLVFRVQNVLVSERGAYNKTQHVRNLAAYQNEIETHLITASRARSSYKKEYNHGVAVENRAEYNAYLKFFGLRNKPLAAIPALDSKAMADIKTREKVKAAKLAVETKRKAAIRLAELAVCIDEWRAGLARSLPYDAPTMLRIVQNKDNDAVTGQLSYDVETSRGARVPVSHAKRALILVRAVVARGEDWQANGHTCKVGYYQIERISKDGTLKAGCHIIPRAEWEAIAPALDAITATAEA